MKKVTGKKEKLIEDLKRGDELDILGIRCVVVKVEEIFYYRPAGRIRVACGVVGSKSKRCDVTFFMPPGTEVETLI